MGLGRGFCPAGCHSSLGCDSQALTGRLGPSHCWTSQSRAGPAGLFDHLVKGEREIGKRQSEFGEEMQSNEVSLAGGNANAPIAGNTGLLVQSTQAPSQGNIVDPHGSKGTKLLRALRISHDNSTMLGTGMATRGGLAREGPNLKPLAPSVTVVRLARGQGGATEEG